MTSWEKHTGVNGFVAHCRCKSIVAAFSIVGENNREVSNMLVDWFRRGLTVEPKFGTWNVTIEACKCKEGER